MRRLALLPFLAAAACGQQDMADQPRFDPLAEAPPFEQEQAARPVPAGTVPYGAAGEAARPAWSESLIRRGRERFDIYCAPCHGPAGDGDGFIVQRGFPPPPSYHSPRLREAGDRHFYDVISDGYGVMFSYADAVSPEDRWAIVAWIRTLQFSRDAPLSAIPDRYRNRLQGQSRQNPPWLETPPWGPGRGGHRPEMPLWERPPGREWANPGSRHDVATTGIGTLGPADATTGADR